MIRMVTERFRKELRDLSPYQLTMAVKEWMVNHDARLQLTFNWDVPPAMKKRNKKLGIEEEFNEEEMLILMSNLREPKPPKPKKVKYVKL